jgi:hypothetical protein
LNRCVVVRTDQLDLQIARQTASFTCGASRAFGMGGELHLVSLLNQVEVDSSQTRFRTSGSDSNVFSFLCHCHHFIIHARLCGLARPLLTPEKSSVDTAITLVQNVNQSSKGEQRQRPALAVTLRETANRRCITSHIASLAVAKGASWVPLREHALILNGEKHGTRHILRSIHCSTERHTNTGAQPLIFHLFQLFFATGCGR